MEIDLGKMTIEEQSRMAKMQKEQEEMAALYKDQLKADIELKKTKTTYFTAKTAYYKKKLEELDS